MGERVPGEEREQGGGRALRRLLALPGYGRLAAVYALNELSWFFGTIALSVLVYKRTGSALGSAGFFLCAQAAPALIGPLVVGRLDRLSPRRVLPVLHWTEAALFVVLAWLASRFALAPVLVLVVVDGVIALVARSLAGGARTELLKPVGMVREGGALSSMLFSVAYLIAPALGGVVTGLGGARAALLVSAGLFALMGTLLVARSIPSAIVHEGPEHGRLRAALRHLRRDRAALTLLSLEGVVLVCFTIPMPIEVVYAVHTMHAGSTGYGVLLSVWGGAAVLGSLAYARWRHSTRGLLASAIGLAGAGFVVLAIAPSFGIALAGAALAGVSNGLGTVAFSVELQEIIPQSWVALAMSLNQSLSQLAPGLGIALGGVLAALVSVRFAFGTAGVACVAFALLALVMLTPARLGRSGEPAAAPWQEPTADGTWPGAVAAEAADAAAALQDDGSAGPPAESLA